LKVYQSDESREDGLLPPMAVGQKLALGEIKVRQSFARPPARYNEASLVRTLEEMGIGRPSTYAPTIDTIQQRGYVIKEDREGQPRDYRQLTLTANELNAETLTENAGSEKNKLFPTDIAGIVNDFLVKHFGDVLDFQFTAHVENEFDEIARGKESWQSMLHKFYSQFHPRVEAAEDVSREEAGQSRSLGQDPKTGQPIFVKIGRFGPYVQLGDGENEEKPVFASLLPGQKMDTISLDEALELFKLPREVGEMPEAFSAAAVDGTVFSVDKGQKIIAKQGPFGPYLEYGTKKYATIKGVDPLAITLEEAAVIIKAKIMSEAEKIIRVFDGTDVKILKGRWGPYITDVKTKKNAKIAKDEDANQLTLEECQKRLEEAPEPKKRGGRKKAAPKTKAKTAAKKTTAKKTATKKATAKKTTKSK